MEQIAFKRLLFKVAFCTMACDGNIDQREIEEMKAIDSQTSFFDGVDLSTVLSQLVDEFNHRGAMVIEELFSSLRSHTLSAIQELLILEVAIRIINSDNRYDENEIKFIHFLRAKLKIHDQTIRDRFGENELLNTVESFGYLVTRNNETSFSDGIELPELEDLNKVITEFSKTNAP